jgi:cytochrome c-type biogenesis protein
MGGSKTVRLRSIVAVVAILAVLVVSGLYVGGVLALPKGSSAPAQMAPTFTLSDIYGHNFTLSSYRNSSVVVIEFTSLSCSECQIVEQNLKSLYSTYNQSGKTNVQVISIFIEPTFGDTISALRAYHAKNNVTWVMAQDTDSLAVYHAYGGEDIPTVVVVDKKGYAVYDVSGAQDVSTLQSTIRSAQAGTASAISIVPASIFVLAVVAGVSTFFSPCAFPMFPGYMGLFLGLNTNGSESSPPSTSTYKGAARRALSAGSVTAFGMIIVFLIIGVALILASKIVAGYIPDLMVVVGSVLIVLGALLLTNLQYWRIVEPLQRLWGRIRGKSASDGAIAPGPSTGRGFYLKLFSYGMGYAAAAAGCVFPVILSAIIAGLVLGWFGEAVSVLIFSLTAAVLMIVVTLALALAGKRFVNQLKAYTPVIKKASAVVLLLVGVYLIYFFYTAWVA